MRLVIQRVKSAEVWVENQKVAGIGEGLLVFVGFSIQDNESKIPKSAKKVAELRVFEDEEGKMNLSVLDKNLAILVVPNFTLAGSIEKGRRPSFDNCLNPAEAKVLFEKFCEEMKKYLVHVEKGVFQAKMEVKLINYGPVTFVFEL